jgi:hypothetical protein
VHCQAAFPGGFFYEGKHMPWNGNGTFAASDTVENATTATADEVNAISQDLATGINTALAKDGQNAMTGALKLAAGTVSLPALSFSADLDCGLYRIGTNNLGVAVDATKILDISPTGLSITGMLTPSGQIVGSAGTKTAPSYSFVGDLDNGLFLKDADTVALSAGDTEVLTATATGILITGTFGFSGDFAINTDKFTVAAATGNVAIAGDVAVATNKFTVAASSGNTLVAGTLAVTGASTLTGALSANNAAGVTAINTAKAFASFSVSGTTVSFTDSEYFNIATIDRSNEGIFTVAFTNALPTANYMVVAVGRVENSLSAFVTGYATSKTTEGFTLTIRAVSSNTATDPDPCEFFVVGF